MLYHTDFRDRLLLEPVHNGADSLKIISGYATHTMASWHITELLSRTQPAIDITLIVGMCPFDGISKNVHEGFKALIARNNTSGQSNLGCQYVIEGAPVHSNIYIWERNGSPFSAYVGSATYTQSAFSHLRRELLHECDPDDALSYYDTIEPSTMFCNHAEIEDYVKVTQRHSVLMAEESPLPSLRGSGVQHITLSLLARGGNTGTRSGLNWGQRDGREPNQAYIPLPSDVARSGFFPLAGNSSGKDNPHFSVLTDDGKQLILRVEQQNNKAITTPMNNSLLGEYFRNRVGMGNGEYVTLQHLNNYGRTDVTFYKLDDEQFFMDFSI
jgi:hypothetical protein